MNFLSEDLREYLRSNKLRNTQKMVVRELLLDCGDKRMSAAEYARRYVKRAKKISDSLEHPLISNL